MNNLEKVSVYFASPWFTDEQAEREDRVKGKLRELGFDVWSPKDNCVCHPNADNETRRKVFLDNCKGIENSDVLFAITDGKDMGTIWEAGYAVGIKIKLLFTIVKHLEKMVNLILCWHSQQILLLQTLKI